METGAKVPVVVPGLVDVHAHLPQYPAVARTEEALLPWLNRHIFPLERGFRGELVREVADAFFAELVANGTTTSVLYTAVWEESCEGAFEAAEAAGVRSVIGKVMMDEGTYGDLEPEATRELSLEETERLCGKWHGAANGLLEYAVSPRGRRAEMDETFTMAPPPERSMAGTACLATRNIVVTLTCITRSHVSISASSNGIPPMPVAIAPLLTSPCSGSEIDAARAEMLSGLLRSTGKNPAERLEATA